MDPFKHMCELADRLGTVPSVDVELETRMIIPTVSPWTPSIHSSIEYFRCPNHPSVTFRKSDSGLIESKEMVQRMNADNIAIVLSIEKKHSFFKEPLLPSITRHIERDIVRDGNPKVIITRENNIFTLEIEFNSSSLDLTLAILDSYKVPMWPAQKPKDAYTSEILAYIHHEKCCLSEKVDGTHAMIYISLAPSFEPPKPPKPPEPPEKGINIISLDDGGHLSVLAGSRFDLDSASYIYEGELCLNDTIYIFDVLVADHSNLLNLSLSSRRANFISFLGDSMILKPIWPFSSYTEFKEIYELMCGSYDQPSFTDILARKSIPVDGLILNSMSNYKSSVYKSKPTPTVDLLFIKNYLYLSTEKTSSRQPADPSFDFQDGQVYEFTLDLQLVRHRSDKLIPNAKMPVEIDPLSKIFSAQGVPSLRYHHNAVKMKLLSLVSASSLAKFPSKKHPAKNTLLDIGSALGADIPKWSSIGFTRVYAVDPALNIRKKSSIVIPVRSTVQTIPDFKYESSSLFFVPWSNHFLPILAKASHVVLILMDNPFSFDSHLFSVNILPDNRVHLSIPHSSNASDITESIPDTSIIRSYMESHDFFWHKISHPMTFGHPHELVLASMYSYYLCSSIIPSI